MNRNCLTIGQCLFFFQLDLRYSTSCVCSVLVYYIFFAATFYSVSLCLPPPLFFFYTFSHCVCQFLSLCLSHSPFVSLLLLLLSLFFFFLVSFEVLNNERAALPVKLIEKSRLKLLGTVHHSWILSSGPHGDEKGGGSIRSIVSMRWQWLHRASIPLAETRTTSAQHSWWTLISRECFCLPLLLWMLNLDNLPFLDTMYKRL